MYCLRYGGYNDRNRDFDRRYYDRDGYKTWYDRPTASSGYDGQGRGYYFSGSGRPDYGSYGSGGYANTWSYGGNKDDRDRSRYQG